MKLGTVLPGQAVELGVENAEKQASQCSAEIGLIKGLGRVLFSRKCFGSICSNYEEMIFNCFYVTTHVNAVTHANEQQL